MSLEIPVTSLSLAMKILPKESLTQEDNGGNIKNRESPAYNKLYYVFYDTNNGLLLY